MFLFATALKEQVCGDGYRDEDPIPRQSREQSHGRREDGSPRVDYPDGADFSLSTARALNLAGEVGPPYARLLRLLSDCFPSENPAENVGASYKQLAYAAHLAGLSKPERTRFYEIARELPMSGAHVGHIIERLSKFS